MSTIILFTVSRRRFFSGASFLINLLMFVGHPPALFHFVNPSTSGFRGRGGGNGWGVCPPSQGFDPLPTQRVPPLYYFEISLFSLTDPKFFLKIEPRPSKYSNVGKNSSKIVSFIFSYSCFCSQKMI